MEIVTKTTRREGPTKEELDTHVLEPGELCWLLDGFNTNPQSSYIAWGVVVKSDENDEYQVEAKFGAQECGIYPRSHLRWMGK